MNGDLDLELIQRMFAPWRAAPPGTSFPARAALSTELARLFPLRKGENSRSTYVDIGVAKYFATASMDIWQRAVHSLLVSVLLSDQSPIWASVTGYYSSHYTFRGLAHLLGCYRLFQKKCSIRLSIEHGKYVCTYTRGGGREHDWYRNVVLQSSRFKRDPFFSTRDLQDSLDDVEHRDRCNYWDHLPVFASLRNVNQEYVKNKVRSLSKMEVNTPPDLDPSRFPDPDAVQVVAYQRLSRFRKFLDEELSGNRLWSVYRTPAWAIDFIDYQVVEPRGAVQR